MRVSRFDRAMDIAGVLEEHTDGLSQTEIKKELGITLSRVGFSKALQTYRTQIGPYLERNITYHRGNNTYLLQHEVGNVKDEGTLAGYGGELRTRRITETISAHGIARTELRRAEPNTAEHVWARMDERGLRRSLEDFELYSSQLGDSENEKRLKSYLGTL